MIGAACLAMSSGLAHGQGGSAGTPPPAVDAGASEVGTVAVYEDVMADALLRVALLDLRLHGQPMPSDYEFALILIKECEKLLPKDVDLVRRRSEAAFNAGLSDEVLSATRRIVELDPRDTVAQLRLLATNIGRLQTVEARLAAYERALGPMGNGIDPSVRSRLALDAALLLRESGDQKGFVARLKQAVQLDSTNKDAALLAYTFFSERVPDPVGRLELLTNLLYADPLDPRVLTSMRTLLAEHRAWKSALRFHVLAERVVTAAGQTMDTATEVVGAVLGCEVDGPKTVLDSLNQALVIRRSQAERAAQSEEVRSGQRVAQKPEEVTLEPVYESIRAAAAVALRDRESTVSAVVNMAIALNNRIKELSDPTTRPIGLTDEQAMEQLHRVRVDLQLWRMLTDVDCEIVALEWLQMASRMKPGDPEIAPLTAWRALRDKDPARAKEVALATKDPGLWTLMCLAEACRELGDDQGALDAYRRIDSTAPLSLFGMIARIRGGEIDPAFPQPGDTSRMMTRYAEQIPGWIETMMTTPRQGASLRAELNRSVVGALEPVTLTVTLRNLLPIPVAIGGGKSMNSRMLLSPMLDVGGRAERSHATPEVLEVSNRLRLLPGEQLSASTRPDAGMTGWVTQTGSAEPSRMRWRVIQGFESRRTGLREPAPGSLETSTGSFIRQSLPEARLRGGQLVEKLTKASEQELPALLIGFRSVLASSIRETGTGGSGERAALAAALASEYPKWSPRMRAFAIAALPPGVTIPELRIFDEAILQEKEAFPLAIAVAARASTPDSPLIAAALACPEPWVRRLAEIQRERLTEDRPTYSRAGIPRGALAPRTDR